MLRSVAGLLVGLATLAGAAARTDDLRTEFERSGGRRTSSYDATVALAREFARRSPMVHVETFGTSAQGRELVVMIVDRDGLADPARIRERGRSIVLVQAGVHAGEIDGKEAGLMLIRDLVTGTRTPTPLDHVSIVFIPIYNVDGHENTGGRHRPNQDGPENAGFRATAQNLNLNRDFMKADAPETRAWLTLVNRWNPDLFVDCHVTDGADYQPVVTYALETWQNVDPGVSSWTRAFESSLNARMTAAGYPMALYCAFRTWHDPRSGLESGVSTPRFLNGYAVLRNRPSLLVEAHSLKDFATRVRATRAILEATLGIVADERDALRRAISAADAYTARGGLRGTDIPLAFKVSYDDSVMVDFPAFDYHVEKSDLTGGNWVRYSDRPVTLRIPYFDRQVVTASARVPLAYAIPPEWHDVIALLNAHGVRTRRVSKPVAARVQSIRFENTTWQSLPFEGRHPLTYATHEFEEHREFPAGTVIVETDQVLARVAIGLLEPLAPDACVRWGFFDASFEEKEYIESYVIEALMRDMLARDRALAREFAEAREDSAFAADPERIRRWFYVRSPHFEQRAGVYPVARVVDRRAFDALTAAAR